MAHLICDVREREGPIKFIKNKDTTIETLKLGDYAICYKDIEHAIEKILYIFERKTWKDLAASIKDGRYEEQKKRLIELNTIGDIKCFYIIEGPMSYEPEKLISRVPFKTLESAKISIMLDLSLVQTKNAEHTMEFLENFVDYVNRKRLPQSITGGTRSNLKAPEKTAADYKLAFWHSIKGISENLSHNLIQYSISEIFALCTATPELAIQVLSNFKYVSGHAITKKAIDKIINSITNPDSKCAIKMLSAFPLISAKSAEKILTQTTIAQLTQLSVVELMQIKKSDKQTIGGTLATKFHEICNLK